ncbi:type II toxin-antitoxin system RelB/DinJ family antitoxin [Enterobacter sp.]|uniref:type II toxin-antitoxin system RelB/DinJ family antitoxin n=1 Tax=Enterobacter sp. TaxID=42895 RepID=UPI00296EBA44|nr:type II toxin-antitoxin system RelB/DinJ family antitoxin [Enterobacter sp.]
MDALIRTRIDSDLKDRATAILHDCGLNMSTALRMFVEQVVIQEGLPFDVKRKPSAELLKAMEEANALKAAGYPGVFNSTDDLMDSLDDGK